MDRPLDTLVFSLDWLAVFLIAVWALYVTLVETYLRSIDED